MTKPLSSASLQRFKDANNESGRYDSSNNINGRPNRWTTFTTTQAPNARFIAAEEKARKSQVFINRKILFDKF